MQGLYRRCRRWWIWPPCARRVKRLGGDTAKVNPLSPVDLVIDHSVTVDRFGDDEAFERQRPPWKWSGTTNATLFCAGGSRPSSRFRRGAAGHR
ncbi:hypothetical protein LNQ03_32905 [Klebsiella pneumoniae subsp. pneumoniae]|nr:hypothetical protein [Klebsiella pneumoniae subsp. pneumoniae]